MTTEISADELRRQVTVDRPHVVLLGAGASLAALPDGDRNGVRLPLMKDFVSVLQLGPLLDEYGIREANEENFEKVYSSLAADPNRVRLLAELEQRVHRYFSSIELPDGPTLYDHLLLSLRRKDVVATFNWDPLLTQAYDRNRRRLPELPSLFFLHGAVTAAYCPDHSDQVGNPDRSCRRCGKKLVPSRLLYPVEQKNYSADQFISGEWTCVRAALRDAFAFTVFGYSAPTSDAEAKELLLEAWSTNRARDLVETEVIDVKPEMEIEDTWRPFFYSHHFNLHSSFYDSYLGLYSRRSCEALWNQVVKARWVRQAPLPRDASWSELDLWLHPYLDVERAAHV